MTITELDEEELRLQILLPLLQATPDVTNVTDVHGQNERGLDVIFSIESDIERLWYGLQLKQGNISGGGTGNRTVKQLVDQLQLADDFAHPVATKDGGMYRIDRFVIATSGKISSTARQEIASRLKKIPVIFWDSAELIRRIHRFLPQLFQVSDGASIGYLKKIQERFDALDALDQIPGVAKRTLSQVYEEPTLRRIFDPGIAQGEAGKATAVPALQLIDEGHHAVIIADQDGGKTSLLRMTAITIANDVLAGNRSSALPLLVRAKDVLQNGLSLKDAIAHELRRLEEQSLLDTLDSDLTNGMYFVMVDGFSELMSSEDKDRVIDRSRSSLQNSRQFSSSSPLSPTIFSNRGIFRSSSIMQSTILTTVKVLR